MLSKTKSSKEVDQSTVSNISQGILRNASGNRVIANQYALVQPLTETEVNEYQEKNIVKLTGEKSRKNSARFKPVLGRGVFGTFKLAFDINTNQVIGVKKIKGSGKIEESKKEAHIQGLLTGKPHIMPLYHSLETIGSKGEKALYQFMPVAGLGGVDGLKKQLATLNDEKLKELIIIHIAKGLLIGLFGMHQQSVYHLDIKPSNLVINRDGEVFIIDFGCSVQSQDPMISLYSRLGDYDYFSPERWIATQKENVSAAYCSGEKVDLWAVGITLFELLTYKPPASLDENVAEARLFDSNELGRQKPDELLQYIKIEMGSNKAFINPDKKSLWYLIKQLLQPTPEKRITAFDALNIPLFTERAEIHNTDSMQTAMNYLKQYVEKSRGYLSDRSDVEEKKKHEIIKDNTITQYQNKNDTILSQQQAQGKSLSSLQLTQQQQAPTLVPIKSDSIHYLLDPFYYRPEIIEQLKLFIPLDGSLSKTSSESFPLLQGITEKISNNNRVLLLLADAGSGKSLFAQKLTLELLAQFKVQKLAETWLPIYLSLTTLQDPTQLLPTLAAQYQMTVMQLQSLVTQQATLFILDGYDEQTNWMNLYLENKLYLYPNIKLLITCRPSALPADYHVYFLPYNPTNQNELVRLDEIYVQAFTTERVKSYIEQYIKIYQTALQADITANRLARQWGELATYQMAINTTPGLKELIKTPLLCRLALEALPYLPSQQVITRAQIYEAFIQSWIAKHIHQKNIKLDPSRVMYFAECLSLAMYQEKLVSVTVNLRYQFDAKKSCFTAKANPWLAFFEEKTLTTRACLPIQNAGSNQYKFMHYSIQEFLFARRLHTKLTEAQAVNDLEWNEFILTADPIYRPILYFLADYANTELPFVEKLWALIGLSKKDKSQGCAAANALTTMVASHINLCNRDFSDLNAPHVDLSGAMLWGSNFSRANLVNANLQGTCLTQGNLSQAILSGIKLGQWPALKFEQSANVCVYSSDGRILAVSVGYDTILFDGKTRQKLRILQGHTDEVSCIAFLPQGAFLVTGSHDKSIRMWDIKNGSMHHQLLGHTDRVTSVTFSPNGDFLASGSEDNSICVWNVKSGTVYKRLQGHTSGVTSVAFSPQGNLLVSGSWDNSVRVWDTLNGKELRQLQGHTGTVFSVAFSPLGNLIASASYDKSVRLWDVRSAVEYQRLIGHTHAVNCVVFSADGNLLASASDDYSIRLWNVMSGAEYRQLQGHTQAVRTVAFSPLGDRLISVSDDKSVRLWAVMCDTECRQLQGHTKQVHSVAFSSSADFVASGSYDKDVRIWFVKNGAKYQKLQGHADRITSVIFSPQQNRLASASYDSSVRLWDITTRTESRQLLGHTKAVLSVVFSPKGDLLATGSYDKNILVWDVVSGICRYKLQGHVQAVLSVAFSSQGNWLASGGEDKSIRLWDVKSGVERKQLLGHTGQVNCVAFSSQKDWLASGSNDKQVYLWDINSTGYRQLQGHTKEVNSVAFSLHGDLLASGSNDESIRLWDVSAGTCRLTLPFPDKVNSVAFGLQANTVKLSVGFGNALACFTVIDVNNSLTVRVDWVVINGQRLNFTAANLTGAEGINASQWELMQQLGAVGTPSKIVDLDELAMTESNIEIGSQQQQVSSSSAEKKSQPTGFARWVEKNRSIYKKPETKIIGTLMQLSNTNNNNI